MDNLIGVLLLAALLLVLRLWQQHRKRQAQYQRRAQDKGLKPAQRRLLWQVARQQRRNPVLLLRCASAFELCVGEYVRTGGPPTLLAELGRIRVLLGFDQLTPGQPLRTTRQLAQGQTLSLWPAGEETNTPATDCLVVARGASALVTTPLAGLAPPWSPGTPLRACFQREQGAEYRFATQLLACTPHTLSLQHVEQVQRLQAREFLRWDTAFPLTLQVPGPHGPSVLEGQVLNISGGGLRLKTSQTLPIGASVVVDPQHRGPFPLAGVKGKVVATSPRSGGQTLHLQFVDLPRAIEAQIVRRIYQHQLGRPSRVHVRPQRKGAPDDRD